MNRTKTALSRLIAVALLAAGAYATHAYAFGAYVVTTYYSTAAKTSAVGTKTQDCNGKITYSGTRTGYSTQAIEYFCD